MRTLKDYFLLGNDKIDYFESLPFNPPFLDPTAVMEELASWAMEFSSEFPPPEVKRSPIKDI